MKWTWCGVYRTNVLHAIVAVVVVVVLVDVVVVVSRVSQSLPFMYYFTTQHPHSPETSDTNTSTNTHTHMSGSIMFCCCALGRADDKHILTHKHTHTFGALWCAGVDTGALVIFYTSSVKPAAANRRATHRHTDSGSVLCLRQPL